MKQISQHYKSGVVQLKEVDVPLLRAGGILVRTRYSVVSTGTEGMKVREGKMSYLEKARARPDQVKQVVDSLKQQGPAATYRKVLNRLDAFTPLGYALSGVVERVGADADEFRVGQAVACAGVGYANHAEWNFVPRNLVVPVPDGVSLRDAAFATLGAIALQGYRQGGMQLGESACVVGLGLIGQILVQILVAGGMRVVGVDVEPDRCALACRLGADAAGTPNGPDLPGLVREVCGDGGADAVFLCTGTDSNQPLELAVRVVRDRGRLVDIGKTRLDLPWKTCFEKELEVRFSRSYGPGRYDPTYEEQGIDYPIGYVRWTERRNLAAFLDLVAKRRIDLDPIVSDVIAFAEAERVYQALAEGSLDGLGIVFEHEDTPPPASPASPARSSSLPGSVRLGVVGAGNYANSMLLPHLAAHPAARLHTVATATSLSGARAAATFGFGRTTTDWAELVSDPGVDAVVIATRHASHAEIASAALRAGKSVFVEKPLALTPNELAEIREATAANDRLLVGFNRRYSTLVQRLANRFRDRRFPLSMVYRVQAGQLEPGSWYLESGEGSRFLGEAGHFFDVFAFLTGSAPIRVQAAALSPASDPGDAQDNLAVTVSYADGSVGTLHYVTQGGGKLPKEWLEVHGGGQSAQLDNYRILRCYSAQHRETFRSKRQDKGQRRQMQAFVESVQTGGPMPISLACLLDTTAVTLAATTAVTEGQPVELAHQ